MRQVLITSTSICRNAVRRKQPAPFTHKRTVATMTYSAFDFEVFGKVQGVFFRATTIEQAKKLGLVGHVENTSSGTVTGEAQGQKQPVSQLKEWLQHTGPSGARIDKCNISNERDNLDKLTYSTFEKH